MDAKGVDVNILSPYTFSGLLFGAMLPYAFSALTINAVNRVAEEFVTEYREQTPHINKKEVGYPNHERCITRLTNVSFTYWVAPVSIIILSPICWGTLLGFRFVSGLVVGAITAGIQIGFSASNSGGAWINAKKYVQHGNLSRPAEFVKEEGKIVVVEGDIEYKAASTCQTIGNPLMDSTGPSINILIKGLACVALVFGTFIIKFGGQVGGGIYHGHYN